MTINISLFWLLNHSVEVVIVRPPFTRKSVLVRRKDSDLCGNASEISACIVSIGAIMVSTPLDRDFPIIGKNHGKTGIVF